MRNITKINDKIEDFKKYNNENQHKLFKEKEFIILRELFAGTSSIFYLVFHRENLYIYAMKKNFCSEEKYKHEYEFCIHFYGFLIDNSKTIGFIYEFMCNSSLNNFISSQDEAKKDELFSIKDKYFISSQDEAKR